ncbi:hypothetical protein [Escherichia coli]
MAVRILVLLLQWLLAVIDFSATPPSLFAITGTGCRGLLNISKHLLLQPD